LWFEITNQATRRKKEKKKNKKDAKQSLIAALS